MIIRRVGALIIKNKRILLVAGKGSKIFWTPGGKANKNETHRQALKRELMEELSIKLTKMKMHFLLLTTHPKTGNKKRNYYYLAEYVGAIRPNNEIERIKWCNAAEILSGKIGVSEPAKKTIIDLKNKNLL